MNDGGRERKKKETGSEQMSDRWVHVTCCDYSLTPDFAKVASCPVFLAGQRRADHPIQINWVF